MQFIYSKLRDERKARNLTIKQLSQMSNVSPGMISSIERGLVNPSVDVLFRICNALNLSVDYFLPTANDRGTLSILKKNEQYSSRNDNSCTYFTSPLFEKLGHSVLLIHLKPRSEYGRRHIVPESDELVLVIHGKITLHYAEQEYVLEEGDSAYFNAGYPHYVKNNSSVAVTLVWCLFK